MGQPGGGPPLLEPLEPPVLEPPLLLLEPPLEPPLLLLVEPPLELLLLVLDPPLEVLLLEPPLLELEPPGPPSPAVSSVRPPQACVARPPERTSVETRAIRAKEARMRVPWSEGRATRVEAGKGL